MKERQEWWGRSTVQTAANGGFELLIFVRRGLTAMTCGLEDALARRWRGERGCRKDATRARRRGLDATHLAARTSTRTVGSSLSTTTVANGSEFQESG